MLWIQRTRKQDGDGISIAYVQDAKKRQVRAFHRNGHGHGVMEAAAVGRNQAPAALSPARAGGFIPRKGRQRAKRQVIAPGGRRSGIKVNRFIPFGRLPRLSR